MFIDSHAHINFNAFNNDAEEVIRRALNDNVWMILAGSEAKTSRRALDLANRYQKGVYAAVGLHPIHLQDDAVNGEDYNLDGKAEEFSFDVYDKLASFEKVIAIGETGLDYYHIDNTKDLSLIKNKQKVVFIEHLKLARRRDLPIIIHCRQAHDDMIEILTNFKMENRGMFPKDRPWGVMHCFSGNEDLAWKYFNLGLLISFTGLITFSKQWDDLIRRIPSDKFLIETDCPYMTPEPFRGQRNEPVLVKYVADRIAAIRNVNISRIEEVSTENARRLFRI